MTKIDKWTISILLFCIGFAGAQYVWAEGPEYNKGEGLTHAVTCDPPTLREENAEGEQLPITEAELDYARVYLYSAGDLFTPGTLLAGPVTTDIYCNHQWAIDDFPSGQKYTFADIVDTDGRESKLSVKGGPFLSVLPLMPPAAPVVH